MSSLVEEVRRSGRLFILNFITTPLLYAYVLVGRFVYPPLGAKFKTRLEKGVDIGYYSGEYVEQANDPLLTFKFVQSVTKTMRLDIIRTSKEGQKAPNEAIVSPDGKTYKKILDLQRKDRPLVLNFGSCTWPPFIAKLSDFNTVVDEFSDVADFVTIYIEEAHAIDGWFFAGNQYKIMNHRSLEDRLDAATMLLEQELHTPVWVDTMTDACNKAYGGKPERLVVIQNGIVVYEGKKGPMGYRTEEVRDLLKKQFRS